MSHTPGAFRQLPARVSAAVQSRAAGRSDEGMVAAEYAMGTVAACGFSGVLYKVLTSDSVLKLVTSVVRKAFNLPGF